MFLCSPLVNLFSIFSTCLSLRRDDSCFILLLAILSTTIWRRWYFSCIHQWDTNSNGFVTYAAILFWSILCCSTKDGCVKTNLCLTFSMSVLKFISCSKNLVTASSELCKFIDQENFQLLQNGNECLTATYARILTGLI